MSKAAYDLRHEVVDFCTELLWPTRCVVCDAVGELLCAQCRAHLAWINQRYACPECGSPHGWLTCTDCGQERIRMRRTSRIKGSTELHEVWALNAEHWECRATICALEFAGAGARLATILKDAHELRLAAVVAAALATALDEASAWPARDGYPRFDIENLDALCFVPATAQAYLRRGYDHMELVTQALSALIGLPVADVLVRSSSRDQRKLSQQARRENLFKTVGVVGDVSGARLLLVDDVITTGATIRESARALRAQGACAPTACALARVW